MTPLNMLNSSGFRALNSLKICRFERMLSLSSITRVKKQEKQCVHEYKEKMYWAHIPYPIPTSKRFSSNIKRRKEESIINVDKRSGIKLLE